MRSRGPASGFGTAFQASLVFVEYHTFKRNSLAPVGEPGVKIYRAMIPDADGKPQVGRSARQLGVRARDRLPHNDVRAATPDDMVNPGEGMSAAPNSPANLTKNRRPSQINGGTGKDPVWEIDTDDIGPELEFIQDTPTHGVVGAKVPMTLAEFEQALAATRAQWNRVIG